MNVMKLNGPLLDFWVAKSENLQLLEASPQPGATELIAQGYWHPAIFHPSRDWSQAGPIIAGDWYSIEDALIEWFGPAWPYIRDITEAPLTWMLRAYVKTKFGDEVEDFAPVDRATATRHPSAALVPAAPAIQPPGWLARLGRCLG